MRGRISGDRGPSRRHASWSSVYTETRVNDEGGRRWDGLIMLMKAIWPGLGVEGEMEDTMAFNIKA